MRAINLIVHTTGVFYGVYIAAATGYQLFGILGLIAALFTIPLSAIVAVIYHLMVLANPLPMIVICVGMVVFHLSTPRTKVTDMQWYELKDGSDTAQYHNL